MEVLKQDKNKPVPVEYQIAIIFAVVNGYLNEIEVDDVRRYEEDLFAYLRDNADELMKRIVSTGILSDDDREELEGVLARFTEKFRSEVYHLGGEM